MAENQIRESLYRYLRGEISLDHLEDWLVERSWNMHRDSDEGAQKLAAAIELRLAEHSSDHLDESSLRGEFLSLINRTASAISFGASPAGASDSNNYVIARTVMQIAVPDRRVLRPPEAVENADRESATARG